MNLNSLRALQRWFISTLRKLRARLYLRDADWRRVVQANSIPLKSVRISQAGELELVLKNNRIKFSKCAVAFRLLASYDWLQDMDSFTACEIEWSSSLEAAVFSWDNAKYVVKNAEEVFILREIYLLGDYDFAACSPCVILDIGANVGFTSIFFTAENPDVVVVGYEPLKINFETAQKNVALNPHLAARINFHNFGLFSETGKKRMQSEISHRGRSSILIDRAAAAPSEVEFLDIQVVRATSVVADVLKEHPGKRVIAKIDCEGSEYEILRDLFASGYLNHLSAVVMEWHELPNEPEGVDGLRKLLVQAGYDVCSPGRLQTRTSAGMIFAFNTRMAL